MVRIAVFVSGSGSNLQAIMDACQEGQIKAQIALVISDKAQAYALKRAEQAGIPTLISQDSKEIIQSLRNHDVTGIVLAGYLKLIPKDLIALYPDRIVNIHPSLIPAFSGYGYYGLKVHQAAIERGVKVSGASVHLVNASYDEGPILAQAVVPVFEDDRPEDLQARVLDLEHRLLPETLASLVLEWREN